MAKLIKNALYQGKQVDLLLENGMIAKLSDAGVLSPEGSDVVDAAGYLLLPGLVDCHTHLDKTVWGMDWYVNRCGPLLGDMIDNERGLRSELGLDPERQAARHIELSLGLGTLHLRSHVDIDTQNGLSGVEGVLRARETYRDLIDVELVAFPQSGLLCRPGTYELLDEALSMGVDAVGGLDPATFDRDPAKSIDATFRLAEKHGKPVDIHLHEPNELGGFDMELIIDRTVALGMQGMVTISHAFCLGSSNTSMVESLIEKLREADVSVMTAGAPYAAFVPPVKQLLQAGVNICGGNDNIRDLWSPYGSGDVLERMKLIAMRNALRRDDDIAAMLPLGTGNPAKMLRLSGYGIEAGNAADFVLARAGSVAECIVKHPADRLVFRRGELVAQGGKLLEVITKI